MQQLDVWIPTGSLQKQKTETVSRLSSIEGINIAFLDNLKPQSDQVLNGIRDNFGKRGMETAVFKKVDTPTAVPETVVQEMKQRFHAMVTGVGD